MRRRFPEAVEQRLIEAGWTGLRDRRFVFNWPSFYQTFSAAHEILAEFGGLHVRRISPGVDFASGDIHFVPLVHRSVDKEMERYAKYFGIRLCPMATAYGRHVDLYVGEEFKLYWDYDREPDEQGFTIGSLGNTFEEGVSILILGMNHPVMPGNVI